MTTEAIAQLMEKGEAVIKTLDEREQEILRQRGQGETLEAVGRHIGFTRERIRQLQNIALMKLRWRLENQNG